MTKQESKSSFVDRVALQMASSFNKTWKLTRQQRELRLSRKMLLLDCYKFAFDRYEKCLQSWCLSYFQGSFFSKAASTSRKDWAQLACPPFTPRRVFPVCSSLLSLSTLKERRQPLFLAKSEFCYTRLLIFFQVSMICPKIYEIYKEFQDITLRTKLFHIFWPTLLIARLFWKDK